MDKKYAVILEELYAIDPGLRQHDQLLTRLLEELLREKPAAVLDEAFKAELRSKLIERAASLTGQKIKANEETFFSLFSRQLPVAAGVMVVIVLLLVGAYYFAPGTTQLAGLHSRLSLRPTIQGVNERAFGDLSLAGGQATGLGGGGQVSAVAPTPESEGTITSDTEAAVGNAIPVSKIAPGFGGGGGMVVPGSYSISYVYKGEPLSLTDETVGVLRRTKNMALAGQLGGLVQSLDMGLVDLGKFSNTQLQNINYLEDRDFGYAVYINLTDNSISISENWMKWPNPTINCRDEACYRAQQLQLSDMPSDDALIAIADQFVADYGIDVTQFGSPFVNNDWRLYYDQVIDKTQAYVPDIVAVTYPQLLDGQYVYDEAGNRSGLSVNVNVRYKRVSGVWGLQSQTYQKSQYTAETDVDRLLSVAAKGGLYGWQWEGAERKLEVDLGTPAIQYLRFWNYVPDKAESDELYIPALVFPVTSQPEGSDIYRKAVVVPLVKEILDQQNNPGMPIPLAEPAAQ